jgi:hypothetical protein
MVPVGLRDSQQLGDHRDGERLGQRRDQVDLAGAQHLVDQPVHEALHGRPELLDPSRRERLRHQAAHPGVIRRLHVEDAVADQVPERPGVFGVVGLPHLRVRGQVQVGPAEPAVA